MKPLELRICPPRPKCLNLNGAPDYYCELRPTEWDDELDWDMCPGCKWYWLEDNSKAKHLTPAECAAEYWRATRDTWEAREFGSYGGLVEGWPNDAGDCYERESTLERFATLPHAAEKDYE